MKTIKTKPRQTAKRILILCEGETEEIYLKGLKQSLSREKLRMLSFEIELGKRSDQASLVKQAVERLRKGQREKRPFDAVWVIFDHDNFSGISKVFEQADKHDVKLGYSRISIEVWFILHFEQLAAPFLKAEEAVKYLKKNHLPRYHKTKMDHFTQLQQHLPRGKANAAWLREIKSDQLLYEADPITTLDKLVSFIEEIAR